MMRSDNYIAIVISPEARRRHGARSRLYFPFANRDMRSITHAQLAAERAQAQLEARDIDVTLAIWRSCDMLDLPIISGATDVVERVAPPPPRPQKPLPVHRYRRGRIGEQPRWWESHNAIEAAR